MYSFKLDKEQCIYLIRGLALLYHRTIDEPTGAEVRALFASFVPVFPDIMHTVGVMDEIFAMEAQFNGDTPPKEEQH